MGCAKNKGVGGIWVSGVGVKGNRVDSVCGRVEDEGHRGRVSVRMGSCAILLQARSTLA